MSKLVIQSLPWKPLHVVYLKAPLLFLLYINDLPGSSKKLTFTIFADDTSLFYSSKDPEQLQSVINEELGKVLKFCAANMLSINFKKTNYMIITSPKKKTNIRITACNIEQKSQIKYLGVFIDEHLKWDAQLQHINNKITKTIGIVFKVRHYVPRRGQPFNSWGGGGGLWWVILKKNFLQALVGRKKLHAAQM